MNIDKAYARLERIMGGKDVINYKTVRLLVRKKTKDGRPTLSEADTVSRDIVLMWTGVKKVGEDLISVSQNGLYEILFDPPKTIPKEKRMAINMFLHNGVLLEDKLEICPLNGQSNIQVFKGRKFFL